MRHVRVSRLMLALAAMAAAGVVGAAPQPDHMATLRDLIHDAAEGRIRYRTLTPQLAAAIEPQAETARAELTALGQLKSVELQSVDAQGVEFYRAEFDRGVLEWAFSVNGAGLIDNARYRRARN